VCKSIENMLSETVLRSPRVEEIETEHNVLLVHKILSHRRYNQMMSDLKVGLISVVHIYIYIYIYKYFPEVFKNSTYSHCSNMFLYKQSGINPTYSIFLIIFLNCELS
jgi:hypothetical protein